jgi:hypothetical protein
LCLFKRHVLEAMDSGPDPVEIHWPLRAEVLT